jgi:hypothetical protein
MNWDVSFVLKKVRQQFLKIKNLPFKSDDFSKSVALDVKSVSLI